MRDLCQGVGLVHELRQLVCSKERVDHRRQGLGVDQINRSKDLVVTNIHTLANCSGHTSQTNTKLLRQLLPYSSNTSVRQVIDIINLRFGVDQFDQVFNNGNDVVLGQDLLVHSDIKTQFLVHSVSTNLTKVVSLIREEKLVDNSTGRFLIGRLGITQLTIDVLNCLFLRVCWILLQGVVDDGVIRLGIVLLVKQDGFYICIQDLINMLFVQNGIPVQNDLVSFNGNHFPGIFIYKIFVPGVQNTSSQFAAEYFFQSCLGNLDLFRQIENFQNILIALVSDGAEQSSYW